MGTIGIIIRHDQGSVLTGEAKIIPAASAVFAEAVAMKEAHELAIHLGIKDVCFETDSLEVFKMCTEGASIWKAGNIGEEINALKNNIEGVKYNWCKRDYNRAADEITKLCRKFHLPSWSSVGSLLVNFGTRGICWLVGPIGLAVLLLLCNDKKKN